VLETIQESPTGRHFPCISQIGGVGSPGAKNSIGNCTLYSPRFPLRILFTSARSIFVRIHPFAKDFACGLDSRES
jgi:hypothetical protein